MMSLRSFGAAAVVAALVFAAAPSAMASAAAPKARFASPAGAQSGEINSFEYGRPTDRNIYICQSSNYKSLFVWQTDGNLVDYDETGRARWSSGTAGRGDDVRFGYGVAGDLTVLDNNQDIWWNEVEVVLVYDTYLTCQDDGNVVIYEVKNYGDKPRPLWSTRTAH